jgi:hypothetical protein
MVMDRVGWLCRSLARDPGLRSVLDDAGVPARLWDTLVDAVRDGPGPETLTALDAMEDAAAAAGIDGITSGTRRFQALPDAAPGFRTARAWRCPHAHPCGRVEVGPLTATPACSLTAEPLVPVKVVSG